MMEPDIGVHGTFEKRLSWENTIEKKRKIRQARKYRLKSRWSKVAVRKCLALERELECQQALLSESERTVKLYKRISRSFWERWQWELQQRRQAMIRDKMAIRMRGAHSTSDVVAQFQQIDPTSLLNPTKENGQVEDVFVGRGCFAVVKLQLFRGIEFAVVTLPWHFIMLSRITSLLQKVHGLFSVLKGFTLFTWQSLHTPQWYKGNNILISERRVQI